VVFGREFGAGQKSQVCCFGLLTRHTIAGGAQSFVRRGAVSSCEAAQSGQDSLDVRLNVSQVIFIGERTVAENTEKRVSSSPLSRLSHPNVFGEISDERCIRLVDDKLAFGLSADQAVGQDDFTLRCVYFPARGGFRSHDLLSVDLDSHATDEMLAEVTVEGGLQLLFTDWQNVVENSLPSVTVQGRSERRTIVASDVDPSLVSAG